MPRKLNQYSLASYLKTLRPFQWIKNLIIFIPLILTNLFFDISSYLVLVVGFIILAIASSTGFVINDLYNVKEDLQNPKKRNRPIASGKVDGFKLISTTLLLLVSLLISNFVAPELSIFIISLLIIDFIYSSLIRNKAYVDIFLISLKYPIRILVAYFLLALFPDIRLLFTVFFISLVLSCCKRKGEMQLKNSWTQRKVLKNYKLPTLNNIFVFAITGLFISSNWLFQSFAIMGMSIIIMVKLILFYINITFEDSTSFALLRNKQFDVLMGIYIIFVLLKYIFGVPI